MLSRLILLLGVLLLFPGAVSAKFYDIESADGVTIKAEILRFTDSGAVIVRDDGSQHDITTDMLSKESQNLLKSLKRSYDLSRVDQVRVSVSTNRESKDINNYEGSTREVSHYEKRVRLRRPRDLSLNGITVKYMIFVERDGDTKREKIITGEHVISDPDSTEDIVFKTQRFSLNRHYIHAGYWWERSRNEYKDDDLGIWLKFYDGDKEILEYSNPGNLLKKREWKFSQPRKSRR